MSFKLRGLCNAKTNKGQVYENRENAIQATQKSADACTSTPPLHTNILITYLPRFERKSYLLSCLLGAGLKTKLLNWPTYKHTHTHTQKESNVNVSFFVDIKTDLNYT